MDSWLKCKVSPGQFSVEYAIRAVDFEGNGFSLFAPSEFVEVDRLPEENESVDGMLLVQTGAREGDLILIRLPAQILGNGQYVTVREEQLCSTAARQEV